MEVRSSYRYARISPKKARDVAREIQNLPVSTALNILNFTPRKAAHLIGKTVKSAVANAENNFDLDVNLLVVKEATVNDGPRFRRFKARARGSAGPIRRRTSHIDIILTDEIPLPEPKEKKSGGKKKSKTPSAKKASKQAAPAQEVAQEVAEETPAATNES
ncbi:MAG: large subunit ribosomal protein L22 [Verrucomicrobiales bacterium]|jgi:large subunit ribosomal protein L22